MQEHFKKIFTKEDVFTDILGQTKTKKQLKGVLLMGRNVIIFGPPGIGKTTIAKNVAKILPTVFVNKDDNSNVEPAKDRFVRVQGSPDLTAEDLIGDIDPVKALKFGPSSMEAFTPGKIFKANGGVLFFDELNRCPEKVQNALLQVLEEGRATLGSYTVDLPANFIFIGTMNPQDTSATEKLSDVFLDRCDIIHMEYPETIAIERQIVLEKGTKIGVEFPQKLLDTSISFVHSLRAHKDVLKKPSVRATKGIYERAQANAYLAGRNTVNTQDVSDALLSVLAHRIELKPSVKYLQSNEEFVKQQFQNYTRDHTEIASGGL